MSPQTIQVILLLAPLLIGGIITAANAESINNITEKAESWVRKTQMEVSQKTKWFSRYISHPLLWVTTKFCDWTDSLTHRGVKNGIRVAAVLYLLIVWCVIVYVLVKIVIFLVIIGAILFVLFKLLFHSNEDSTNEPVENNYQPRKRIIGSAGPGQRVNPETGRVQKKGFLGWEDTDRRINPDTGKVQEEGLLSWENSETRVNQDSGKIQTEGFFRYEDTGVRINPETGIIQKEGFLGWEDTDERIDPQTGKHQKQGLIGWVDTDS